MLPFGMRSSLAFSALNLPRYCGPTTMYETAGGFLEGGKVKDGSGSWSLKPSARGDLERL